MDEVLSFLKGFNDFDWKYQAGRHEMVYALTNIDIVPSFLDLFPIRYWGEQVGVFEGIVKITSSKGIIETLKGSLPVNPITYSQYRSLSKILCNYHINVKLDANGVTLNSTRVGATLPSFIKNAFMARDNTYFVPFDQIWIFLDFSTSMLPIVFPAKYEHKLVDYLNSTRNSHDYSWYFDNWNPGIFLESKQLIHEVVEDSYLQFCKTNLGMELSPYNGFRIKLSNPENVYNKLWNESPYHLAIREELNIIIPITDLIDIIYGYFVMK